MPKTMWVWEFSEQLIFRKCASCLLYTSYGNRADTQRFPCGFLTGHYPAEFHISVGKQDGIVNGRPQLYRADDQISYIEQGLPLKIRDSQINPDRGFNHQGQDYRQGQGLEIHEQNKENKGNGQEVHSCIILGNGCFQILCAYQIPCILYFILSLIHI